MNIVNEEKLSSMVGVFLVLSHFSLLFMVVVLAAFDRFTLPEMFTSIGLMLPLFTAYTTAIVRRFLSIKSTTTNLEQVAFPRIFVALFIPSVFVLFIFLAIIWKSFSNLDFDHFTALLVVSETAFGIYIGMIVKDIFEVSQREQA